MKKQHIVLGLITLMVAGSAFAGNGTTPGKPGTCEPKLTITKEGPETVKVGDKFKYSITVCNMSACALDNVRVVDILPDRAKFVKAKPEETRLEEGEDERDALGGRVFWENISLAIGACEEIELKVHAVGPPDSELKNRACATHPFMMGRVCDRVITHVETGPVTH